MMKKLMSIGLGLSLFALMSCEGNGSQKQTKTIDTMSRKEQVLALLKSFETGDTATHRFINPKQYTQHNLAVGDGLKGFEELTKAIPRGAVKVNTIRAFEDGDFVFTHTEYDFFGPKIGFDIFRFEDGQIVEHWDNLMTTPAKPNPSGHITIDGATEIKDLDKTASNKALVERFVYEILMEQAPENIHNYIDDKNYTQHNPDIADGLSGLVTAFAEMAKNGTTMTYTRLHKVLGEGNFVLAVGEGSYAGSVVTYYDLFRVDNGRIVEHWDVIEPLPDESQWQNQNGKFGF